MNGATPKNSKQARPSVQNSDLWPSHCSFEIPDHADQKKTSPTNTVNSRVGLNWARSHNSSGERGLPSTEVSRLRKYGYIRSAYTPVYNQREAGATAPSP